MNDNHTLDIDAKIYNNVKEAGCCARKGRATTYQYFR